MIVLAVAALAPMLEARGWKLAPPWRPSPAARDLAASLRDAFAARPELREDAGGITVGMRGYFGFSSHRYTHASSPYTPAVLVELGFVTNAHDRERMVAGESGAVVHRTPDRSGSVLQRLEPGDRVRPVDERDGWYEVRFRNLRGIGWVSAEELVPYDRLVRRETEEDERGSL